MNRTILVGCLSTALCFVAAARDQVSSTIIATKGGASPGTQELFSGFLQLGVTNNGLIAFGAETNEVNGGIWATNAGLILQSDPLFNSFTPITGYTGHYGAYGWICRDFSNGTVSIAATWSATSDSDPFDHISGTSVDSPPVYSGASVSSSFCSDTIVVQGGGPAMLGFEPGAGAIISIAEDSGKSGAYLPGEAFAYSGCGVPNYPEYKFDNVFALGSSSITNDTAVAHVSTIYKNFEDPISAVLLGNYLGYQIVAKEGDAAPGFGVGAEFGSWTYAFTQGDRAPGLNTGLDMAFLGYVVGDADGLYHEATNGHTPNDVGLFLRQGLNLSMIVRAGVTPLPGTGGRVAQRSSMDWPVLDTSGQVYFYASTTTATGGGDGPNYYRGIWKFDGQSLVKIAYTGDNFRFQGQTGTLITGPYPEFQIDDNGNVCFLASTDIGVGMFISRGGCALRAIAIVGFALPGDNSILGNVTSIDVPGWHTAGTQNGKNRNFNNDGDGELLRTCAVLGFEFSDDSVVAIDLTSSDCPADFDGSGFVDLDDYEAFVPEYEAGCISADVDNNGFVDFDDFNIFVAAFENGC